MNSRNCWMPSAQQRKVKPLEGVVYLWKSGNIHGGMKLATWIFSGVRNSVPKSGSNKNTFWSTTNTTSPTLRLSVASLHFLWVLSVARNSSLQCLQNSFTRLRISIQRLLRSKKVSMGWWLLRLSSKILALLGLSVNFFQLLLTKKLKINFFCFKG